MNAYAGRDDIRLMVYGNDERLTLMALYDNLGKGASGTALQCINVMLGLEPTTGLVLGTNSIKHAPLISFKNNRVTLDETHTPFIGGHTKSKKGDAKEPLSYGRP